MSGYESSHQVDFEGSFPSLARMPEAGLPEVAFAGRSNVGKSSCINALLNRRKAARVSQRPGRTQLLNLFTVDRTMRFVDLPGYGYAKAPRKVRESWGPMVEGYLRGRPSLALMVLLLDIRRDPGPEDRMIARWLAERRLPVVVLLTKADKLKRNQRMTRIRAVVGGDWIAGPRVIPFSSTKREGLGEAWAAIREAAGLEPRRGG